MFKLAPLQTRLKVTSDGIWGPATATALFAYLGAKPVVATSLGRGAATALPRFAILDSGLRLAHFLAQVGHESGGFRFMEEIWGPTPAQRRYEGRRDLGNVRPGDGYRYKGRGPIQLTGRANYADYGEFLDLPLEAEPAMAADPEIGILLAAAYWHRRGLNKFADQDDLRTVTKRINGGFNGLEDRSKRLVRAKVLAL